MSRTVFKYTWRKNWKLLLIFLCVLCAYQGVIISLADPDDMKKIQGLFGVMGGFLDAFGISLESMTTPLAYTASTFFGVLVLALSMVFYLIQIHFLVTKPIADTSAAYTLSAPVSRSSWILARAAYLLSAMAVLFAGILLSGALMLRLMGEFDFVAYLRLVTVTWLLCGAVSMLSYFLAVAGCQNRWGSRLSIGVPVLFLLLCMLSGAGGEKLEWMKKITPFGWLDSVAIVTGESGGTGLGILSLILIFALTAASVIAFRKKRLAI